MTLINLHCVDVTNINCNNVIKMKEILYNDNSICVRIQDNEYMIIKCLNIIIIKMKVYVYIITGCQVLLALSSHQYAEHIP